MEQLLEKKKLLPLLFLKEAKTIDGKTKFHKMIFLSGEEDGLKHGFEFLKYNYGPYSFELSNTLATLIDLGLIKEEKEFFDSANSFQGKQIKYSLTEKGEKIINSDIGRFEEQEKAAIKSTIKKWNDKTLKQIINHVYEKYMKG